MEQHSDFDYYQEIARSGFGDMLHDLERNNKYYEGLKLAFAKLREKNGPINVLDIGTGSGLLSMMAVQLGADSVTACEAFRPMANTAEKIFEANGMGEKVKLLKMRSTEIVTGKHMPKRANVLVTEVFDTELIGEGAMEIFNHAHEHLLEPECLVVPHLARIYAQLVQSPFLDSFNRLKSVPNLDGEVILHTPSKFQECSSTTLLFDVQLSQFEGKFQAIAPPKQIMTMSFSGQSIIEEDQSTVTEFVAEGEGGTIQAILFWWDLLMDPEGSVVLSCAPSWAHPELAHYKSESGGDVRERDCIPWRDHWMQAIYYPLKQCHVLGGECVFLNANHGGFSWWFNVSKSEDSLCKALPEPFCTCGLHQACSRHRIAQMNYSLRNKACLKYFERSVDENATVLTIGHGSVILLAAAVEANVNHLYCFDDSSIGGALINDMVKENKLTSVDIVTNANKLPLDKITHIVAEPYFANNILPWHSLRFFNILKQMQPQLMDTVQIFPSQFSLFLIPVHFLHLHKIRQPMGTVNTFNVEALDRLLEKAYTMADENVEPHSLFEYPSVALSEPVLVQSIQVEEYMQDTERVANLQSTFKVPNECESLECNGIVLYTTWNGLRELSSGPSRTPVVGELIDWDPFSKQAVHFVKYPKELAKEITINVAFNPTQLFVDCTVL